MCYLRCTVWSGLWDLWDCLRHRKGRISKLTLVLPKWRRQNKSLWKGAELSVSRLCDGGHAPAHTKENLNSLWRQALTAREDTKFCSLGDAYIGWRERIAVQGGRADSWGEMPSHTSFSDPGHEAQGAGTSAWPWLPLTESPAALRISQSHENPPKLAVQNKSLWLYSWLWKLYVFIKNKNCRNI